MYVSGNVAHGKVTIAAGVQEDFISSLAVDGNTEQCFKLVSDYDSVWWMLDLGTQHVIHNVTLYFRMYCKLKRRDFRSSRWIDWWMG